MTELPVVVIGAGPVGLAAAAELVERDIDTLVLERRDTAGAAVSEWGHIRLFSRWAELTSPAARTLLTSEGWQHPDGNSYPTGADWVERYLRPLAAALGSRLRLGTEVTGVARTGRDRVVDSGRADEPLAVHIRDRDGTETRLEARAVIDASGTWQAPNPLGADGLPATGERAAADRITYRVPDVSTPAVRDRYAGKHVVIAGSGHSAMTALLSLDALTERHPDTRITWLLRRDELGDTFGGGEDDQLPARGELGMRARSAVNSGRVTVVTGFRTEHVTRDRHGRLVLTSTSGREVTAADEVIALAGFRPDLSWLSEVRLELDPVLQAPTELAPLIDPNVHSCGTVYPHGERELSHPEPGMYVAGMKSYGRAPTFLALTGYEQVRSIAAALAGDHAAAERVELTLPETGVCSGSGGVAGPADEQVDTACGVPTGPSTPAAPARTAS
ncbi:NAD(P)-binding domain-containing protein [Haloechinothrix sp. YIM 98757]|uniref:NAD(P)-binding domain-containing protein n=1 Tax=Haloechinothrix aidingensis TaxID=2752311 RepID=A0A838AER0_9PSEU|nr:FAD-dependent oxidoreductase [Haloechinothrix aidingensis]MBA0127733.1 NAD(P)-binding domain-containing protein [Haloechinothrix aidingensis]